MLFVGANRIAKYQGKRKTIRIIFLLISLSGLLLLSISWVPFVILLYKPYSLVSTTNVAKIHRQSVPLIGILDNPSTSDVYRFSEPDLVPIAFYTLRDCSSDDSFMDVEINETMTVNFSSSTDKSKAVTELYLLGNTTLTLDITTDVILTYATNHCIAFVLVYDDLSNYINFISNHSGKNFYHKECIVNEDSQTINITFNKPSYYYIGVYTDIPTEATTFTLHFLGTYLQYDISNENAVCSIASINELSCKFSLNTNSWSQEICIVGSVSPSTRIKGTTVNFYTPAISPIKVVLYALILPMTILILIYTPILFVYYCYFRDRYFVH